MTANTAADAVKPAVENEEITVSDFYQSINQKNDILLLDVRNDRDVGLQFRNKDHFITYVLTHLPSMPEQYVEIKRVNIGLAHPDEQQASELELGKNVCALSDVYEG